MKTRIIDRRGLTPADPLWARVPTRDEQDRLLSDFMLLVPDLRRWPEPRRSDCIARIRALLAGHQDVVFADLNLRLNLLWVSVRSRPGACSHIAATLCEEIPEARLVAPNPECYR